MRKTKPVLNDDFLRAHRVLDVRILVAVSGGADSLALLWLLRDADFPLRVAHINHGLRGRESDDDADFVRDLCARENIEYSMCRVQVENHNGHFSEDAARRVRYSALIEIAREHGCAVVATGHTADDNLETILLHLARGATVGGWSGIPPTRVLAPDVRVVRPLLNITRAQTEAVCVAAAWSWRTDSSNSSTRIARNRVRHEIVPLLASVGHKSRETLAIQTSRAAQIRRDENIYLDERARLQLESLRVQGKADVVTFDGARWRELPLALQRRVLLCALHEIGGDERALSDVRLEQIEEIRCHVTAKMRRKVWCLPAGARMEWTGAMSGNRIRLWRVESSAAAPQYAESSATEKRD